jgi:gamma-glutamylcyclotransferase (GGCT)/AIG2-like uncharacterized protein YtfP
MNDKHLIFVYGTLKKVDGNGAQTRHLGDATFMGACSIPGVMVHLGYYPGLVHDPICRVTGEVYEVTTKDIQGMDAYEGTPHNYSRRLVETPFGRSWAYFKNHVNYPMPDNIVCVDRGLWQGGEVDRAPYSKVRDFYQNKRWNEPEYRNMEKKPIVPSTPESGAIGSWDDTRKCFVFPDGSTHSPPGLIADGPTQIRKETDGSLHEVKDNVVQLPVKVIPTTRGVELM